MKSLAVVYIMVERMEVQEYRRWGLYTRGQELGGRYGGSPPYILPGDAGDRVLYLGTEQDRRAGPSGTEVTRNRSHVAEPKDAVPSGAENCGTEI